MLGMVVPIAIMPCSLRTNFEVLSGSVMRDNGGHRVDCDLRQVRELALPILVEAHANIINVGIPVVSDLG